ncbi:MAG: alpha/beta hydrolase [Dysgonomonas sp.]|nr:alpha/beta hydrolase [Dysgonomonas sp.]
MKKSLFTILLFCTVILSAQNNYELKQDISYIDASETDAYRKERCKLDIYYPTDKKDFPVVVWFHGGGLEGGGKFIPNELKEKGIAVVAVNYRLSPKATNPAYIVDAAESVAWTFKYIAQYGGSVDNIYVSGHSAGGYLTLMVGLDKSYMAKYGVDADKIKGLAPISGQTNTHYTIRKERGIAMDVPIVDSYSPLNQARKGIPPTLLVSGDRRLEMTARYEENAHLDAILRAMGNSEVKLYEVQGFDHGAVCGPGCLLLLDWIKKYSKK